MEILICVGIFCLFIILITIFSTKYTQFIYQKMYLNPKQTLDSMVMQGAAPLDWRKLSGKACVRRLKKLEKFVKSDRFYSREERQERFDLLAELRKEYN